ncbi:tetratricopeptide repeat protein [Gilvimarinus sp. DA14]|uniref:tetratricopeptide repeat protein n=1 Tax=Gilvimarinus sp. DA14 TaxID=2956798 RepID=UPI0020B71965|nr:tetratricopeptide repeat protein [Gilvimarinus sp. DA14]UTF59448.1 tetratricopeptide repeat protein [Gilvimarinus sp. DA14]
MRRWWLIALLIGLCACTTQQQSAEAVFASQERAERYYQQGNYNQALTEYRSVLDALPEHTHSWLRMGNCFAQLGRYPEAVSAYEQALLLQPDFASAWINLSYVQAQILARTVAEMYEQVPKTDPQIERVQELVDSVLAPFGRAQSNSAASPAAEQGNTPLEFTDYDEQ